MNKKAIRNVLSASLSKTVSIIGPFVVRTIIIYKLGYEYVGLNSLFTAVLNVLNMAELGFGSALTFSMYKPVSTHDNEKISALLNFYKSIYKYIGFAVLLTGLLITPFIKYLIKGTYPNDINIYILFIIYLANTYFTYSFFSYRNSLLIAHRDNNLLYGIQSVVQLFMYIAQSLSLLVFNNYYIYIILMPLFTIINNILVCRKTERLYPEISTDGSISKTEKDNILAQVKALFTHKLAGVLINSLDNIVISVFLGLVSLSLFSNYFYIINAINGLIDVMFASIVSIVGNKLLMEDTETSYSLFLRIQFAQNLIIAGSTICFYNLFTPFVKMWIGNDGVLPHNTMLLFCIYFYSWKIRTVGLTFRDASGLWKYDTYKSVAGVVLDFVLDFTLVKYIGIDGALISTIVIMSMIFMPWETWVLKKHLFKRSMRQYNLAVIINILLTVIMFLLSDLTIQKIWFDSNLLTVVVRFMCSIVITCICVMLPQIRSENFKYFKEIIIKER